MLGHIVWTELSIKVKWYRDTPESVLEIETFKTFWDFEIKTDHIILARQPDIIMINKSEGKKREEPAV